MSYRGVPVLNLLLYYNLIVHGNAASQKSLLQFFVDLKKEGNFDLLEDYYAFMSEIDTTVMNDLGYDYD
jgi:hypothetical protein